MAAKKKETKSSIVTPKKKPESNLKKQTAVNEIKKGKEVLSTLGKGGSGVGRIAYEVTGAGDLKRFVKNPSLANARNLAITAAAYAVPVVAKSYQGSRAIKAAAEVRAAAPARATAAANRAANTTRVVKPPRGLAQATTRGGGSMSMSGVSKISMAKSPTRAAASSLSNSARKATKAAKDSKIATQRLVAGAKGAAAVVGGGKGLVTHMENRNKKKKK